MDDHCFFCIGPHQSMWPHYLGWALSFVAFFIVTYLILATVFG